MIDFTKASHDQLDKYGMALLVNDAPELSVILRGHMLIEQVLEALISLKMKSPDRFFKKQRPSFEFKIDLAAALGVLPDSYYGAAKAINGIRNSYAHNENYQIKIENLHSLKIHWAKIQQDAFLAASEVGIEEATRIAIIFLNWSFLKLLPQWEHEQSVIDKSQKQSKTS